MTLKNIFKFAVFSLLLNSSGVFAADYSAVLGKWDIELNIQGQDVTISITMVLTS